MSALSAAWTIGVECDNVHNDRRTHFKGGHVGDVLCVCNLVVRIVPLNGSHDVCLVGENRNKLSIAQPNGVKTAVERVVV